MCKESAAGATGAPRFACHLVPGWLPAPPSPPPQGGFLGAANVCFLGQGKAAGDCTGSGVLISQDLLGWGLLRLTCPGQWAHGHSPHHSPACPEPWMRRGCACGPCLTGRAQFPGGARCGSEGARAFPQACWPHTAPASGRELAKLVAGAPHTPLSLPCQPHGLEGLPSPVCGCSGVGTHPWSPTERAVAGWGLPSLHLATPIPVSEFVQEAVRESLPCKAPMGSCPAALPCQCLGSSPRPQVTVLPSPSPEQGPVWTGVP